LTSDPVDSESCVVDANVFYSQYQRNVFMTLAVERLFALHWTDEIEAEWLNALERNRPDLGAERLQRTARAMKNALPRARLTDYRRFESLLTMTDTKDRHVAAAAIGCAPCTRGTCGTSTAQNWQRLVYRSAIRTAFWAVSSPRTRTSPVRRLFARIPFSRSARACPRGRNMSISSNGTA
jgi:hypothetical protein